jgi:hypothetical protein
MNGLLKMVFALIGLYALATAPKRERQRMLMAAQSKRTLH